jgi:hypothetical protein
VDTFIVPVTFTVVERLSARFSKKSTDHRAPKPQEPTG